MKSLSQRLFSAGLCWAALIGCSLLAAASFAQAPMPPAPTPDDVAAAEGKPATPLREQTIYIPYAKLRSLFEKEGRGVFLPYDKFQQLWKAAQAAAKKIDEIKPPVDALISEIDSVAVINDKADVVEVTAKLKLEVLRQGWNEVPLRLKDAAIRSAKLGDNPARLLHDPATGYRLLFEKKGKDPEQLTLELVYARAYTKSPGTNSVQFDAPLAPVNRWEIRIAQPGVKVNVHPKLSATETTAEMEGDAKPEDKKETRVEAFVGAAEQVRIDWTPKAEGAAGLTALATVQVRQEVTIDERVVRTRATLVYDISRADLNKLQVALPADHDVVNVFDDNVKGWTQKNDALGRIITVDLFQPARGTQNLVIELEKFIGDKEMPAEMARQQVKVPVIRAIDVGRQQGVLVVRLADSLRSEVDSRLDLLQIDAAELPQQLAGQTWAYAFRYSRAAYDLTLTVESVKPQIEVDQLAEVFLEPQQTTLTLLALYNIQRAGVFQLEVDVPEGFDVRQVVGRDIAGAAAVQVDSHHLAEREVKVMENGQEVTRKSKSRLNVNLSRKALGKVALLVELQKRSEDPNLLTPTGKKSAIEVPIVRVNPQSVARSQGRLLVYTPESLSVHPTEQLGLRPVSPAEAVQGLESLRAGRFPLVRELLAFAFTQEPASLKVEAERRRPYIEVQQTLIARIEQGVVKYESQFAYDVRYSGVKSLRLDVPTPLVKELRNQTPAIRERAFDPQPTDVSPGYTALELSGEAELLGGVQVKFTWEQKLAELAAGKGVKIRLPILKAKGVDRFWGQIAATRAETIDIGVDGEATGLRPIDPRVDLKVSVPDAARAFEFHDADAWSLTLLATRYELEAVKKTSVELGLVRMVATRSGQVTVQALYRMRSAKQRIQVKLPDNVDLKTAFDTQPLRINGQAANLESDTQGNLFIPLVGHSPETPVVVELRYTYDGVPSNLQVPTFLDDETAVQQIYLAAYLPEEQRLLGLTGPWTAENRAAWPPKQVNSNDEHLLQQIRASVAGCETLGRDFRTDGTLYLFSALRPTKDDSLRLVNMNNTGLQVLVFALIAIVGILLTSRPLGDRLWYLAALVVGIVLIAVLLPTLARSLTGGPTLYLAIGLVILVWLVRFLVWALPGVVQWIATRPVRTAATASAVAAAAAASTTAPAAGGSSPFRPGGPGSGTMISTPAEPPTTPTATLPEPPTSEGGARHE
ncbi:hypothetical protein ETAA8_67280 [Anatilimnocola aggregata]|uniref:Uncharacterized protein n=1 Tax=Anatilimnocola aggregata TaxID=2528021 RepID=A0A517YMW9_9BACT|nr:hypothetical protein [Anatilimnocola aggregata]QDU31569.1 hypothetical protein ETAA8_67280 [Anatilimnocola aggregata]